MALDDNIIEVWHFDEASGDALGAINGYDLTETSGTIAATTGKLSGGRVIADFDTEYFIHSDNADLSTGDITFSFMGWVNLTSKDGAAAYTVFGKINGSNGDYLLWHHNVADRYRFQVYTSAGYGGAAHIDADTYGSVATGGWHFIACGHNATTDELWISVDGGAADVLPSHTTGVYDSTAEFRVGDDSFGDYADITIDELVMFKRDIRSDLASFYNGGAGLAYPYSAGTTLGRQQIINGGLTRGRLIAA